ncbi:hypothetical protein K3553_02650 [Leisingera aquaemixtae]|nr:hypothetical protein [Leisingera aquaemixtae]UWQ25385.1 hypothetical protein K3553_02650 [Leisingera aquaemixtae]
MNKTLQQAYQVGQRGGTVNTNGMSHQQKEQIDKARNDGWKSNQQNKGK